MERHRIRKVEKIKKKRSLTMKLWKKMLLFTLVLTLREVRTLQGLHNLEILQRNERIFVSLERGKKRVKCVKSGV